jgi:multidrug efflux pump
MNISRFFVDRPVFAGVLSVLIVVAGLIGMRSLPISEYPEVVPPSIVVRATYPGANPKVIAETVATPLEEQINGVEGMLYMSSQATSDGVMTLTVTFKLGTNPDQAQQLVQNRVSQAEPRLPTEVRSLGITTVKSSPDLMMVVNLTSPDNRYDITYLRNYGVLNVKDRLARIEGVGQVQIFGSGDYSMRIWIDPQKAAEHNLAASDITDAIRAQNVQAAAGTIGASPSLPGIDIQLNVNAQGRLQTPEEFGNIIVKSGANGEITRLRDVARVELGASDYSLRSLLDSKSAVAIPVFQAPGSNAITISDEVIKTMDELQLAMPEGVKYEIVYDTTQFVRASIEKVVDTLLEAIALVVIVVILFLQTWRASIIPLIAVPVSIIGTFAVMYVFGFSINALSLFGLVLAIGIVVDDAIVVVENVERNIENGLSPRDATYKAMKEVSGPIVAIALVLVAVFVPLAFITGLSGQFYRQFALTIAISTVISAINSLTLSPALAALLLKGHHAKKDWLTRRNGLRVRLVLPRLQPCLQRQFERLRQGRRRSAVAQEHRHGDLSGAGRCDLWPVQCRSRRLRAGTGQAVPDRLRAAAGRRQPRPHRRRDQADERHRPCNAWRRTRHRVPGSLDQRLHQRLECRCGVRQAEAFRGTQDAGSFGWGNRHDAEPEVRRHPGCLHRHVPAAAGPGSRHDGWLQAAARRSGRARLQHARRGDQGIPRQGLSGA